ncbi:hypothetical protein FSP39_006837 [Pinctada imbricata]|uniref:Uncharacterized protein n=1 Tax=Pinctada imbricata TaxID=66713 RepID=A0AA88XQA1_PINIB|nr:hypothetical protein FSP39_006837 [Pinctada imbricata]
MSVKTFGIFQMMKTLAMFNSSHERMCSRLVSSTNPTSYHHDLWLQGSCQEDDSGQLHIQEILYSQYPTSVINLVSRDIKQSPKFTDHVVHNYNEHKNELIGLHSEDTDMNLPGRELFTDFDQADTLVHSLLDELDKLPADCGIREAYISQFVRVIQKKALSLIKYIEGETNYGAQPYKGGMRKLRQDLCIMSDGDFRIILAAAEKLKSGLYWFLFGSGDSIGRTPPGDVS